MVQKPELYIKLWFRLKGACQLNISCLQNPTYTYIEYDSFNKVWKRSLSSKKIGVHLTDMITLSERMNVVLSDRGLSLNHESV